MTALITTQRYNWMGYNGTETEEVDTALMRAADMPSNNYNYLHRQRVIMELKERLLQIKRELDLAPPEDRHSEEEARRRRQEQKRLEEEERMRREAEEAERAEAERQRLELEAAEEEARRQQEAMEREATQRKNMHEIDLNSDDSDASDEYSAVLEARAWTQKEIDEAIEGFVKGTRSLLSCTGNGYVSYLDGSTHPTTDKLDAYNVSKLEDLTTAVAGTYFDMPAAEEHSLEGVCAARDERDVARKKLEALRALEDRTYSVRIRSTEKDADGQPKQQLTPDDSDVSALTVNFEAAKQLSETIRKAYNEKASASGNVIAAALCMRAISASPEAEAAVTVLESESKKQRVAM
ncbi:hypothetical protein GH5_07453 [Leishmania sp. Ghana 2012 LV757]|uniref:hypothetical protein n=1 Tax=Leishmania sp. Ghana 2012 LV757 TaxID=2803181 RepID=UPI001B758F87|nr:hypothetical protein GH5_07453 [Leishmania sp. Ghana 2012 LV757]